MPEHTPTDPDAPFDPAATYEPCCHPKNLPAGTVARDTYDAWYAEQVAAAESAAEARRLASLAFNQQQAGVTDGN